MNTLILLLGGGTFFAFLALVLKEQKKEYGILVSLTASFFILTVLLKYVPPILDFANKAAESAGVDKDGIAILLKVMGVAFLTEISIGICRDCSENALAVKVETAGRLAMLIFSLPLFEKILEMILSI